VSRTAARFRDVYPEDHYPAAERHSSADRRWSGSLNANSTARRRLRPSSSNFSPVARRGGDRLRGSRSPFLQVDSDARWLLLRGRTARRRHLVTTERRASLRFSVFVFGNTRSTRSPCEVFSRAEGDACSSAIAATSERPGHFPAAAADVEPIEPAKYIGALV